MQWRGSASRALCVPSLAALRRERRGTEDSALIPYPPYSLRACGARPERRIPIQTSTVRERHDNGKHCGNSWMAVWIFHGPGVGEHGLAAGETKAQRRAKKVRSACVPAPDARTPFRMWAPGSRSRPSTHRRHGHRLNARGSPGVIEGSSMYGAATARRRNEPDSILPADGTADGARSKKNHEIIALPPAPPASPGLHPVGRRAFRHCE